MPTVVYIASVSSFKVFEILSPNIEKPPLFILEAKNLIEYCLRFFYLNENVTRNQCKGLSEIYLHKL